MESFRDKIRIVSIIEKTIEYCCIWFGHVWRRPIESIDPASSHLDLVLLLTFSSKLDFCFSMNLVYADKL
jgi:hypothetical protein